MADSAAKDAKNCGVVKEYCSNGHAGRGLASGAMKKLYDLTQPGAPIVTKMWMRRRSTH